MARQFSGALCRQLRRSKDLRPEQVAVAIGRSSSSVLGYEDNRITPTLPVFIALADTLGCRADDLLEEAAGAT